MYDGHKAALQIDAYKQSAKQREVGRSEGRKEGPKVRPPSSVLRPPYKQSAKQREVGRSEGRKEGPKVRPPSSVVRRRVPWRQKRSKARARARARALRAIPHELCSLLLPTDPRCAYPAPHGGGGRDPHDTTIHKFWTLVKLHESLDDGKTDPKFAGSSSSSTAKWTAESREDKERVKAWGDDPHTVYWSVGASCVRVCQDAIGWRVARTRRASNERRRPRDHATATLRPRARPPEEEVARRVRPVAQQQQQRASPSADPASRALGGASSRRADPVSIDDDVCVCVRVTPRCGSLERSTRPSSSLPRRGGRSQVRYAPRHRAGRQGGERREAGAVPARR